MTAYQVHVAKNPLLLTSPCAEKFACPNIEADKNVCRMGCSNLRTYHKLLDSYGQFSLGGLSFGHVYASASSIDMTDNLPGHIVSNFRLDY